jgi:hypothetical protein
MGRRKRASSLVVVCCAFCVLAFSSTSSADTRPIKIKGYVTNVVSPTQFDIEDYRITRDATFALEFDNETPELRFRPEDIKVGVELEIKGNLDESTGTLHASSIRVDLEQFKKAKHTAIIAYPPIGVIRDGIGWSGRFVADGQRIEVTPATQVLFKLTSREQKLAEAAAKTADEEDDTAFEPLRSLDQVTAGMLMSYEGPRNFDGTIRAERVTFSRNDLEKGEAKLWNSMTPEVKAFSGTKPPELRISGVGRFKLIADEEVQTYVSGLGQRLIPAHQRDLVGNDPTKINFRFFVVDQKEPNAFSLANGVVLVTSGMMGVLENEAQLAAVVGHEIAHATQEHMWRQSQFHKKKKIGLLIGAAIAQAYGKYNLADVFTMTLAAIQNGYQRSLENQADRVGMEYMVSAGYDPRQAPQVSVSVDPNGGDDCRHCSSGGCPIRRTHRVEGSSRTMGTVEGPPGTGHSSRHVDVPSHPEPPSARLPRRALRLWARAAPWFGCDPPRPSSSPRATARRVGILASRSGLGGPRPLPSDSRDRNRSPASSPARRRSPCVCRRAERASQSPVLIQRSSACSRPRYGRRSSFARTT